MVSARIADGVAVANGIMPSDYQRKKWRDKYATDEEFRKNQKTRKLEYYHNGYKDTAKSRYNERQKQIREWKPGVQDDENI